MTAVEQAVRWELEKVDAPCWTSADRLSHACIEISTEVPLTADGRRLPREGMNRWYPTMASIQMEDPSLLLSDDLRALAAKLIEAADRIDEIDGPPLRTLPVAPGQLDAGLTLFRLTPTHRKRSVWGGPAVGCTGCDFIGSSWDEHPDAGLSS